MRATGAATWIDWIKFPYLWLRYGSAVKSDESVVLFPQSAYVENSSQRDATQKRWVVPIHAWVVEKEAGALTRLLGRQSLLSLLGLTGIVTRGSSTPVFENRLSWFMADREINKKISVVLGGRKFISPRTGWGGHVRFSADYTGDAPDGSILECHLADLPDGRKASPGRVQLVAECGISVISDIDDTVKVSNVTDKRELVRGLFFDDYHPAEGMPEFYSQLSHLGASFHYVSASPWQLYPSLAPFLDRYFPFGCLSQRHFYIGDKSFVRFFKSSLEYKIKTVSGLLDRYPKRNFVLIGDSGEKDPEVYLEVAKKHPQQVLGILIREVYKGDELKKSKHAERWVRIEHQLLSEQRFHVFHHPGELSDISAWFCQSVQQDE